MSYFLDSVRIFLMLILLPVWFLTGILRTVVEASDYVREALS